MVARSRDLCLKHQGTSLTPTFITGMTTLIMYVTWLVSHPEITLGIDWGVKLPLKNAQH